MTGEALVAALAAAYILAIAAVWACYAVEQSNTKIGHRMRVRRERKFKEEWRHR